MVKNKKLYTDFWNVLGLSFHLLCCASPNSRQKNSYLQTSFSLSSEHTYCSQVVAHRDQLEYDKVNRVYKCPRCWRTCQCGKFGGGRVDPTEGIRYCDRCWGRWESVQSSITAFILIVSCRVDDWFVSTWIR